LNLLINFCLFHYLFWCYNCYWKKIIKRLSHLWPGYFLTQPEEIFFIRREKIEKFGIFRQNFPNPNPAFHGIWFSNNQIICLKLTNWALLDMTSLHFEVKYLSSLDKNWKKASQGFRIQCSWAKICFSWHLVIKEAYIKIG